MRIPCYLPVLFLIAGISSPAHAQFFPEANAEVLQDEEVFDAWTAISVWDDDIQNDPESFDDAATRAFILALRRDGIRVEESAPNYLVCEFGAIEVRNAIVYTWDVQYYIYNPEGLHLLLWTTGGIASVSEARFEPEEVAQDCADAFSSEWLRWNPR